MMTKIEIPEYLRTNEFVYKGGVFYDSTKYQIVGLRKPKYGEYYIAQNKGNEVLTASSYIPSGPRFILEKLVTLDPLDTPKIRVRTRRNFLTKETPTSSRVVRVQSRAVIGKKDVGGGVITEYLAPLEEILETLSEIGFS